MTQKTANANGILEGVLWKQMLLYFFPLLLGSFFQQLYNTIDAIIVGRFVGKVALAAVGGSSAMIVSLFFGFFIGVSSGASVTVSHLYGSGDHARLQKAVHTGLAMAVAGGILIMLIGFPTAEWAIDLLDTPADTRADSLLYLRIFYCGMIPNTVYNMGAGILRAAGDSKRPLYVLIASCLCNIVLDILFVLVLHLGVAGVALATILSQAISAVMILYILTHTREPYRVSLRKIRFYGDSLKRMLRLGLPTGVESIMYTISNLMIQAAINSFETDAVSAWAAYGKLDGIFWMVIQALGITVTTFVGQNFGAGKHERMDRSVRTGLLVSILFSFSLSAFFYFFCGSLYYLFTTDAAVVEIGIQMVRFLTPFYVVFVFVEIFAGSLRGMGETLIPMIITFSGTCLLRIIWLLTVVPRWHAIETIEASYPITWGITAAMLTIYYLQHRRTL